MTVVVSADPRVPCESCGSREETRWALLVTPTGRPCRRILCPPCRATLGGPKS